MEEYNEVKVTSNLKRIFSVLVIFSALIIYSIMGTALDTPFYITKFVKLNVSYFLPQGWAFFTRDAREEKLLVYSRANGELVPLTPPGGSHRYLFGLNREGRKIPLEYSFLLKGIDSIAWIPCNFNLKQIAVNSMKVKPFQVENKGYKAKCCGEIIFIKTHTKPWAWSTYSSVEMPSKYIKLYVTCTNKP